MKKQEPPTEKKTRRRLMVFLTNLKYSLEFIVEIYNPYKESSTSDVRF